MNATVNTPLFPLIRHLSKFATPVFMRLPVSANMITTASMVTGLAAAWCVTLGTPGADIAAGALFVITYILDNCDGEIARLKDQCSTFGMRFDSFVDWVVHTALFAGLGIGAAARFDNELWFWMGMVAAAGGTINYILVFILDARDKAAAESEEEWAAGKTGETYRVPEGLSDWALYIFRELTRADFCFIVLVLAVFDVTWVLVPAGAIGSQVYWITQFAQGANDFHV
jgi:phosphatidylglycerophosphate synthase